MRENHAARVARNIEYLRSRYSWKRFVDDIGLIGHPRRALHKLPRTPLGRVDWRRSRRAAVHFFQGINGHPLSIRAWAVSITFAMIAVTGGPVLIVLAPETSQRVRGFVVLLAGLTLIYAQLCLLCGRIDAAVAEPSRSARPSPSPTEDFPEQRYKCLIGESGLTRR
jgi:hypothetical protein